MSGTTVHVSRRGTELDPLELEERIIEQWKLFIAFKACLGGNSRVAGTPSIAAPRPSYAVVFPPQVRKLNKSRAGAISHSDVGRACLSSQLCHAAAHP